MFQGRSIPHVVLKYDLAHVAGWEPYKICMIWHMFPGLDLYNADPAQPLTTAGEEQDDLDHDLSALDVEHLALTVMVSLPVPYDT